MTPSELISPLDDLVALGTLMDPIATAAFLKVRVDTLSLWRFKGQGPDYLKVGRRIRYRVSDLKNWLESRTRKGA